MGLFKSKQEKEIEKKMLVKKTINQMNKHIATLEGQKKVYLDAAKRAKKQGLKAQYDLAITGLKMTLAQQKRAQEMLLNFEITSQLKDMTQMTHDFLGGLSILSKEMTKLTNSKEFAKVQEQFEAAMEGVQTQSEQMEVYLETSATEFDANKGDASAISDDEINALIDEEIGQDEISSDSIDAELEKLKKKMAQKEN